MHAEKYSSEATVSASFTRRATTSQSDEVPVQLNLFSSQTTDVASRVRQPVPKRGSIEEQGRELLVLLRLLEQQLSRYMTLTNKIYVRPVRDPGRYRAYMELLNQLFLAVEEGQFQKSPASLPTRKPAPWHMNFSWLFQIADRWDLIIWAGSWLAHKVADLWASLNIGN